MPRHVWHKHGQDRLGVPVRDVYSNACPDIPQFRQPPDAVVVLGRVPGTSRPAQICLNFALSWQRWPPITERMPSTIKYLIMERSYTFNFCGYQSLFTNGRAPPESAALRVSDWLLIAFGPQYHRRPNGSAS